MKLLTWAAGLLLVIGSCPANAAVVYDYYDGVNRVRYTAEALVSSVIVTSETTFPAADLDTCDFTAQGLTCTSLGLSSDDFQINFGSDYLILNFIHPFVVGGTYGRDDVSLFQIRGPQDPLLEAQNGFVLTILCEAFPGGGSTGGCFPGPGPFPAPEPSALSLIGLGLAGLVALRRRKQAS